MSVLQGNTVFARTTWVYNEPTADGQYLRNTKTVHGDSNTPDIVTTEYLDACGNVAKTGRIIDGTEYFDTYTYDFQGNVLSVLRAADAAKNLPFTEKYEYNYNNQVTKHTNAAGQVITNTYDAFDRLVQTTDYAGTPTTHTYDSLGRLLTKSVEVNPGDLVITKYEYDGEYYDIETGTYYLRARYYDPVNGRFTQPDTWEGNYSDPLSLNRYTYCCNNPIFFIDPSGQRSQKAADKIIIENRDFILAAAEEFDINPADLAATIYAEQILNVDWKDDYLDGIFGFYGILDTSIGISQVKISTAKLMEDMGYMSKVSAEDGGWTIPLFGFIHGTEQMARETMLEDPQSNIRYATAYLRYFQDRWKSEYPQIKTDIAVLATLYNQGEKHPPHANPQPNPFGTEAKLRYKHVESLLIN